MNSKVKNLNKTQHRHHHEYSDDKKYQDEYSNRTLFLSGIPAKSNSLPHLFAHYKRFGHIDAIYTSGNHTSIIFESEESTKVACESPLTVLHNRFIHVSFQKASAPNKANLSSVCDMDIVKNAVQAFKEDIQKESQETEEIRAELKRKAELRKIEKAKKVQESYQKELNHMVQETQNIIIEIEHHPEDEKKSRARLSSLYDMISASQKKIDEIENLIQEAYSIFGDNVSDANKSS